MTTAKRHTPSLRELQRGMAARILGPAGADLAASAPGIEAWLRVPPRARVAARLRVHVDGYPTRVHEALAEQFPAIAQLLGDEAFVELARRFAAGVRLSSYNLNDAGEQLAAFLGRDRLAETHPFLPALADLEWMVTCAFHAPALPAFDPAPLAAWGLDDWAAAVLRFQPSVFVVSAPWPLLRIWESHQVPARLRRRKPEHVVVRRSGFTVRCESVADGEARALTLLLEGRTLGSVSERLDAGGHDARAVLGWFSRWTSAGMLAAVERAS